MLMKNSTSNLWMPNAQYDNSAPITTTSNAATNQLNDQMRKTANELLDSMQDSRFSETEVGFSLYIYIYIFI